MECKNVRGLMHSGCFSTKKIEIIQRTTLCGSFLLPKMWNNTKTLHSKYKIYAKGRFDMREFYKDCIGKIKEILGCFVFGMLEIVDAFLHILDFD